MEEISPTPGAPSLPTGPAGKAAGLESGLTIGDFRVERLLGSGGMGVVYLARQISLDRPVALKVLGTALNREADIARFQREAQAIARLRHPGIATVYFVGQDRNISYIALEFIEGVSLRKVIEHLASGRKAGQTLDTVLRTLEIGEGDAPEVRFDEETQDRVAVTTGPVGTTEPGTPTPEARALSATPNYIRRCVEVARDAASALAHAHERGVIHRDIKPENLLLDRQGAVHVIDFGLARFFEDVTLTNTGALIGTPMYMSPEQVSGRLNIDHRTDIYSLGLVLYELLTLRRPIAAPTREGVLRHVATKALIPVTWQNRAVPSDLEGVVHKATAKDPDERYASAEGFASDLRNCLDGRPTLAHPYRYRLDRGEIVASRPRSVTACSVFHMMLATFWVVYGFFYLFIYLLIYYTNGEYRTFMVFAMINFVCMVALSAAIGLGLFWGSEKARKAAVVFDLIVAAILLYPLSQSLLLRPILREMAFVTLLLVVLVPVASAWVLRGADARRWFGFAERVLAEHRRNGMPL